jgi:hypothetical protein
VIYNRVFNSQNGPHEILIHRNEDGTVELYIPGMLMAICIEQDVKISITVPGPPIPVELKAWFPNA